MATLLVGHVTKDGSVAGPRVLEHLVDVVLQFEGERHSSLRLLRAVKNRFGPADEVGCFEQTDSGVVGVPDPSGLFLSHQALAVASARDDEPLRPGIVAVGEIGLAGEVRRVPSVRRRLGEALRLGFTTALVPPGSLADAPAGIVAIEVADLTAALDAARGPRS